MSLPSVQLYTVREALEADATATLTRLKDIGFTQVEPFGLVDYADALAEGFAATGLTAPSTHVSLVAATDLAPVFEAATRLGVTTLVEPFVPDGWTTLDGVTAIATRLNEVAAQAAPLGLTVGYHNHWFEFEPIDGRPALEVFADLLDPGVVLEVDTYWSTVAGQDTPALLTRLGDRVQLLHVKDGPATMDTSSQVPAGSGSVPVADILAAAPDALRVIEFDDYAGDLFEGITESFRFLTTRA